MQFISIDQNSTPLWDTIPKLQALTRNDYAGLHCLEDVDVAFTRRGADELDSQELEVLPERFYRGGVSDWGATLFYSDFLGRTPVDPRKLEELTGLTLKALGKRLDTDVDGIYDRFNNSDNHQLVGSSYLKNQNQHRTVGDLKIHDVLPHLHALLDHAETDITERFPSKSARDRTTAWFSEQREWLRKTIENLGTNVPLTNLYTQWICNLLPSKFNSQSSKPSLQTTTTSALFTPTPENANLAIFTTCIQNHAAFCDAYNTAIQTTGDQLTKLKPERGDLPFFAVWKQHNRMFRTECHLENGVFSTPVKDVNLDMARPLESIQKLQANGIVALVGKALVLVLQVRNLKSGAPLALPENGSLYMPTANQLECELRKRGLLQHPLHPVLRIKLGFLDRLAASKETIMLPDWLARRVGINEIAAANFAKTWREWREDARKELALAKEKRSRNKLQEKLFPKLSKEIDELERKRRELAQNPETRAEASETWDRIKPFQKERTERFCQRMMDNLHLADLGYWSSRGATLPWAIAAGGAEWYKNEILPNSEIKWIENPG